MSIDVDRAGAIVTVTLDRPEKLNALDLEHVVGLRDTLRELADDGSARVVIVTGAGRGFCAGGDVTGMTGGRSGDALDVRALMEVSELLVSMPAVTIAAINGPCAGAGLSFACACDLRYAARSAVFVSAFLRVGSSGDHGSAWVLTRVVGAARARELLLLGERMDADEASRIGLVHAVLDDGALREHVDAIAARLTSMPQNASRLMKENLNDAITLPLDRYLDTETARFEQCSGSEEAVAAARTFVAQRDSRPTAPPAPPTGRAEIS